MDGMNESVLVGDERWCPSVIRGKCRGCGREMVSEARVNLKGLAEEKVEEGDGELISFGFMGVCGKCERPVQGYVEWDYMWVEDV